MGFLQVEYWTHARFIFPEPVAVALTRVSLFDALNSKFFTRMVSLGCSMFIDLSCIGKIKPRNHLNISGLFQSRYSLLLHGTKDLSYA